MIYISTACFKSEKIKDIVEAIVRYGFKNIELSGGTRYYPALEFDLVELQKKYGLNFLIHNYFPPPQKDFVLNLASSNDDIYNRSIQQVQNAMQLAEKLNIEAVGIHAGFLVEPKLNEPGIPFVEQDIVPRIIALNKFADALKVLFKASSNKKIYIENNVLSFVNHKAYKGTNPFLLTCNSDYCELYSKIKFNLLLDIAHLKVSCHTLNLDFKKELSSLISKTDYLHLSDNDSLTDANEPMEQNSALCELLSKIDLKNKTITLEINQDIDGMVNTYELLSKMMGS